MRHHMPGSCLQSSKLLCDHNGDIHTNVCFWHDSDDGDDVVDDGGGDDAGSHDGDGYLSGEIVRV